MVKSSRRCNAREKGHGLHKVACFDTVCFRSPVSLPCLPTFPVKLSTNLPTLPHVRSRAVACSKDCAPSRYIGLTQRELGSKNAYPKSKSPEGVLWRHCHLPFASPPDRQAKSSRARNGWISCFPAPTQRRNSKRWITEKATVTRTRRFATTRAGGGMGNAITYKSLWRCSLIRTPPRFRWTPCPCPRLPQRAKASVSWILGYCLPDRT